MNPTGIAVHYPPANPADEVLYVTVPDPHSIYSNGSLIKINASGRDIVGSIPVESMPHSLIIAPNDERALVMNGVYSPNVNLIDT